MARYYQCNGCDVTFRVEVFKPEDAYDGDDVGVEVLETPAGGWTLRARIAGAWELFRKGEASVQWVALSRKRARAMAEYILRRLDEVGAELPRKEMLDEEVRALIAQRQEAKGQKDWKEADRIRNQLLEVGVRLMDEPWGVYAVRDNANRPAVTYEGAGEE